MSGPAYVAAIGHISADYYYQCQQEIVVGDKFFVRFLEMNPGGMVGNAASVLAMLGTPTKLFTALGQDGDTKPLLESFAPFGVDTSCVDVLAEYENMRTSILLSPGGRDRTIMLYDTGDKPVAVLDDARRAVLEGAACVYALMSNLKTLPGHKELFTALAQAGVKLMLDAECSTFTSAEDPEDVFYFQLASVVSFNEVAAAQYAGAAGEKALKALARDRVVVITLGPQGCRVLAGDEDFSVPAYDIAPVDTTGAGDTFNAAFLHGWLKGWPLREAAEFAIAASNRAILHRGARGGAVGEAEVAAFRREHGAG